MELTGKPVIVTDRGTPTVEVRRYRDERRDPLAVLQGNVAEYRDPAEPVA